MADPVSFSRWILIMVSLGWAGARPKGNEIRGKPRLNVDALACAYLSA
jgi:hypothetical protein